MNTRSFADGRSVTGFGLLGIGVLLLMGNFGIFRFIDNLLWGGLFLLGAAAFGLVYVSNRDHWWALFPTAALGGIGAIIVLEGLMPRLDVGWILLGALSAAFWGVYVTRPLYWWAIIPGGVLGTLSVVALLDSVLPFLPTGSLFFFGLAGTFVLVKVLGRQTWALIPAAILGIIGTLTFVGSLGRWLFPLALIGLGVLLFTRNQRSN